MKEAGFPAAAPPFPLPPRFRSRKAEGREVSPVRRESSYLGARFSSFLLIRLPCERPLTEKRHTKSLP